MSKYQILIIVIGIFLLGKTTAQSGKIIRFSSPNAMCPDTARAKGHDYNGKHYDAAICYSDSSVLLYVPTHFNPSKKIGLVFWFHGWNNNIDSACQQFKLLELFAASQRNAIFIFPEGPKDAPDSYGGKLEQPKVFQQLVVEVLDQLKHNNVINKISDDPLNAYPITVAGHSGAYRVMSRIINHTPVKEVFLYDALYGGNDAYLQWLSDPTHHFINIYTKTGGTYDNSLLVLKQLQDSLHTPVISMNEEALTPKMLRKTQQLFIYTPHTHNEVMNANNNWERFLRYTPKK